MEGRRDASCAWKPVAYPGDVVEPCRIFTSTWIDRCVNLINNLFLLHTMRVGKFYGEWRYIIARGGAGFTLRDERVRADRVVCHSSHGKGPYTLPP